MKRLATAFTAILGSILFSTLALAADRTQQVAGWTLEDIGSRPGDDTDRTVDMKKSVAGIDVTYTPGATSGASVVVKFAARCKDFTFSSGFQFDDPPADRAATVKAEISEAFDDYRKDCPIKDGADVKIMEGFDEAFRTIDKWVADKPFTFPPEPATPPEPNGEEQPAPAVTLLLPLPGGERAGVRGGKLQASVVTCNVGHPHPTLFLRERAASERLSLKRWNPSPNPLPRGEGYKALS